MIRKKFLWGILLLNLAALPILYRLGHPIFIHGSPRPERSALPFYGQMPAFELVRENGEPFRRSQMNGSLWVVNFIFTRCPNQCPLMSGKFSLLQKSLPPEAKLASFSVDPEHDSVEVLKDYGASYQADPDRWVLLTGSMSVVQDIMSELHLGRTAEPVMHSLRFVLLDKQLRVRGYYDSGDTEALSKMRTDIEELKKES